MKWDPISRRHFLKSLGGTVVTLPFMPSLLPKAAAAGEMPKRFVCVAYDNGRWRGHWYPSDQYLPQNLVSAGSYRERDLTSIPGALSNYFTDQDFSPLKDKITLLRGLDGYWKNTQGHQMGAILAGTLGPGYGGQHISLDQVLAYNSRIYPTPPPLGRPRYLNLGVNPGAGVSYRIDANGKMQQVEVYWQPQAAWNALFGSTGTDNNQAAAAERERSIRVIDRVKAEFDALWKSARISKDDKVRLEEHIDSINELDASIRALPQSQTCSPPAKPPQMDPTTQNYDAILNAHVDIMATALKCNLTKVGTVLLSQCVDNTVFSYLGVSGGFHDQSHGGNDTQNLIKIHSYIASKYARFLKAMNVVEDPTTGSTYLDNSLVLYANSMGEGATHVYYDMPVMLAGSLGGKIRTGKYIDYSDRGRNHWDGSWVGRSYCQLLVTILQAFGLNQDEYYGEAFRNTQYSPGFGDSTVDQPTHFPNERPNPLPGLYAR